MADRLSLHTRFIEILGSNNVYFQPPESVKISYPAIIYSLDDIEKTHADNGMYRACRSYSVTLIDRDPDSPTVARLSALPFCRFNRYYSGDNLNHWNFSIYF